MKRVESRPIETTPSATLDALVAANAATILADMATKAAISESIAVDVAINQTLAKSQKFFADLAAESRKPHFGDQTKSWVASLLVRAEEAGIYAPEKT